MSQPYGQPNAPAATFDLDIVGMLRRRLKHIVLGVILGVGAGLGYYFTTTPMFESQIEVLVGQRSSELATSGTSNDGFASGTTIQEDILATHMDIFTSERILKDAITAAELNKLYSFKKARENGVAEVDHLLDHIQVSRGGDGPVKDANVISATFKDPRPEDAAVVLAAVYESYKTYVNKHSQNHSEEAAELIEKAQKVHERELADADLEYRQFISSVPVFVDGDKVTDIHRDRLMNLEKELNTVRSQIAETRSRAEVIETYLRDANRDAITDIDRLALLSEKEVQRLKLFLEMSRGENNFDEERKNDPIRRETAHAQYTRLLDLYAKQRKLAEDFGPGHPNVQATMQEIEVIKDFIAQNAPEEIEDESIKKMTATEMLGAYRSLLKNDLSQYLKQETALLESTETERKLAKQVEASFMKGSALKAKLERAQGRYDEVQRRLQEIQLSGNYAGFSTDLLATPEAASEASWPKLPLSVAVGLLLGGLFGTATALMAELADSTFRDAKDLETTIGAPVLTHVAPFQMRKLRKLVDGDSKLAPQLCAFHGPRSQESEVYRTARTSLLLNCKKHDRKVLMMTSPAPGDGKSTTLANLAISLAQTGKRVLLIDADLRRPMVYNLFGADGDPGLTDIIDETKTLDQAVQPSEQENLDLLPHGTRTGLPAELLESYQFGALLEEARKKYDLVMIDAPPVLAVTDPAIIATQVDGAIMTVQIQKNGRRPVERAAEILREINIVPVGVIVNNSDQRAKGYGYSHDYYGDSYGYIGKYYDDYSAPDAPTRTRKNREKMAAT